MSDDPILFEVELSPEEVRRAAAVLEKISTLYEYMNPKLGMWSADDLRDEIPNLKDRFDEEKLLSELAGRLFSAMEFADGADDAISSMKIILREFNISRDYDPFAS